MAIAVQKVAAKEFGVPLGKHLSSSNLATIRHNALDMTTDQIVQNYGKAISAHLRSQYDLTQAMFKKAGVNEVVVFRGQGLPRPAGMISDVFKADSITLQPISSFSAYIKTARSFAVGDDEFRSITAMVVPADRVLGTATTGYGCITEAELVVIGGENMVSFTVASTNREEIMKIFQGLGVII